MSIAAHFATLDDPRVERTKHHSLLAILTIALYATICGADGWVEVAEFGRYRWQVQGWGMLRLERATRERSNDRMTCPWRSVSVRPARRASYASRRPCATRARSSLPSLPRWVACSIQGSRR